MKSRKNRILLTMLLATFIFPMSSSDSNSLQSPDHCPGPGILCSKIRVACNSYMCSDLGDPCTIGENWPILMNFGDDGIWAVTCRDGAVVGED